MRKTLTFLLPALLLAIALPALQAHSEDAASLWLQAESAASDPVDAVAKWKKVTTAIPAGKTIGDGLTHDAANLQLFQALLNAAVKTKKVDYTNEALTLSNSFDVYSKVFADTMIGQTLSDLNHTMALDSLRRAKANAMKLSDMRRRSESLHAIALAALSKNAAGKLAFGWDGTEIAEDLLPYVTPGKPRAQLMQLLASYQPQATDQWQAALQGLVKIADKDKQKQRDAALLALHGKAKAAGKFNVAVDSLVAMTDEDKQQETLNKWFEEVWKSGNYSQAAVLAAHLSDGRYAANAWGKMAVYYAQAKEIARAQDAAKKSYDSALSTRREDRRFKALQEAAEYAGNSNNPDIAKLAMQQAEQLRGTLKIEATGENANDKAVASYIKSLAESGKIDEALKQLKGASLTDSTLLTNAVTAVAKAMAENKKPQEALDLLGSYTLSSGDKLDKAYYAVAKGFTGKNDFARASEVAAKVKDASTRMKIEAYIASKRRSAEKSDASPALDAPFFSALNKQISALPKSQQDETRIDIAELLLGEKNLPFDAWRSAATTPLAKDKLLALKALNMGKLGQIEASSRLMKQVTDARLRARSYHRLAREIALHTDQFGLIGGVKNPKIAERLQQVKAATDATQQDVMTLENTFATLAQAGETGIEFAPAPASEIGFSIPPFDYPERLEYDYDYIKAKLPPITPFAFGLIFYENSFYINSKFLPTLAYSENNMKRGIIAPKVLYLYSGTVSLPLLYDALQSQGINDYIEKRGTEYTLTNTILIGPDATLVIDSDEVSTLYQTKEDSSVIINGGNLYITGTRMIAWDSVKKQPIYATYEQKNDYRPFIASWSRSHTYMGGNEVVGIGYSQAKSYGLSFSAGPEKLLTASVFEPKRPTGIIADNSFINAFYGYYSYEADDMAIIGNEYRDNVVYGVDPHDRSHRLTIAFNSSYEAQKKHGIIVSREVNDSSYVGNLCFDNKGSGFMIDRLSHGTFVYGNTAFGNKQDGLTLFESSCNFISSNHFFNNRSIGIRVRNSTDNGIFFNRLTHNKQGAVNAYTSNLREDPAHIHRNFTLDPHGTVAALSLVGNHVESNGAGFMGENISALLMRNNVFINQSPRQFSGKFFTDQVYFSSQYDLDKKGAVMIEKCPNGEWIPYQCRFRDKGFYRGDAQDGLQKRISNSRCQTNPKSAEAPHA